MVRDCVSNIQIKIKAMIKNLEVKLCTVKNGMSSGADNESKVLFHMREI